MCVLFQKLFTNVMFDEIIIVLFKKRVFFFFLGQIQEKSRSIGSTVADKTS